MRSKQPCAPHRHSGPSGPDCDMADLAGLRIRAAIDGAVDHDAAADAGRKRHIEERIVAFARAVRASPSAPALASLSMTDRHAEQLGAHARAAGNRSSRPRASRAPPAARRTSTGPPKPMPQRSNAKLRVPGARDRFDLAPASSHARLRGPSSAIRGAPCGRRRTRAIGELRAADVDRERVHSRRQAPPRGEHLVGDAVPVPFFMIVTDATRLPNRAAVAGSPVTAQRQAAPAEKLSPAPQISTGCSTGTVVDPRLAVRHRRISAPSGRRALPSAAARHVPAQRLVIDMAEQPRHASSRLLAGWASTITSRNILRPLPRIHPEHLAPDDSAPARSAVAASPASRRRRARSRPGRRPAPRRSPPMAVAGASAPRARSAVGSGVECDEIDARLVFLAGFGVDELRVGEGLQAALRTMRLEVRCRGAERALELEPMPSSPMTPSTATRSDLRGPPGYWRPCRPRPRVT